MKRRNAETGKLRRPLKRTKITEGMYGNSLLYLKFIMLWATVVLADYMLEFRFEFLWPFWMMIKSIYESFKYQGVAFSVFFICVALTSDMICFFFIPLQYIFFVASTYVWVQYVWYSFADKGICLPTLAICLLVVYVESLVRGSRAGGPLCRPLAANCVGFPAATLGFGVKSYVAHRVKMPSQKQTEFYFQFWRDAMPDTGPEQCAFKEQCEANEVKVNGSANKRRPRSEANPHADVNKSEKSEKQSTSQNRSNSHPCSPANVQAGTNHTQNHAQSHVTNHTQNHVHLHSNGNASGAGVNAEEDKHEHMKTSAKSLKCEKREALREERRRRREKEKANECSDNHKTNETLNKDSNTMESTKESVKCNSISRDKDSNSSGKERDKEREREAKERDREREREAKEREREQREARECIEELVKVRAEVMEARESESEAKRILAAERSKFQHKLTLMRNNERATMERRLSEERRNKLKVSPTPTQQTHVNGECEWCKAKVSAAESELSASRRELQATKERAAALHRDLARAKQQIRTLEGSEQQAGMERRLAQCWAALQERAAHLEQALGAETRVKLDLLRALGEANRAAHKHHGIISKQEKEIEELKAQMLAVMPTEYMASASSNPAKMRMSEASMLDPNASVYTPKQLCSDA